MGRWQLKLAGCHKISSFFLKASLTDNKSIWKKGSRTYIYLDSYHYNQNAKLVTCNPYEFIVLCYNRVLWSGLQATKQIQLRRIHLMRMSCVLLLSVDCSLKVLWIIVIPLKKSTNICKLPNKGSPRKNCKFEDNILISLLERPPTHPP